MSSQRLSSLVLLWLIAAAAGVALAAVHYFRERRTSTVALAAALRAIAVTFAIALLLDAPRGRAALRAPMVALDASASWQRGRADTAWRYVLERARREAGGDTLWLTGDSLRAASGSSDSMPLDAASRVDAVVNRALGAGRPLVLFSDGEIDDPEILERLLAGSRIDIAPASAARDVALLGLEAPRSAVGGDTIEVVLRLSAGSGGSSAGSASIALDRAQLGKISFDSLAPYTERDVRAKVRVPAEGGEHRTLRAVLSAPGDVTPRNDSLGAAFDVASAARAVFVSTAPDQDSRFALEVLRGTVAIAVRAYYRVAPNVWRQEPGYTPATEADVRAALAEAPIAIIHGDTALFGAPRSLTAGALALLAPGAGDGEEWYAVAAPTSPLIGALTGLPWDSLPPIAVGASPKGEWTALAAQRRRSTREERVLIAGSEQPRRVVVVSGSGYWRWRFRAGASTEAFAALWGGVFDWMASGGDDRRGAVPATAWARTGDPIAWRRGARRDSVVAVQLRRSGDTRVDTVTLRFPGSATVAESPPLPVGEYDITVPGGRTRLVVAESREWLPRRPTVSSGDKGTARASGLAPRLRDAWWAYVLALAAVCMEWLARRRAGLR